MLPGLHEPAHESAASLHRMAAARLPHSAQQAAEVNAAKLEHSALEAAALEGSSPAPANTGHQDSCADVSASPEVFTARRQHGRGGRSQHVLADSDEDSPGSSPAAATWASASSEVPISASRRNCHCHSTCKTLSKRHPGNGSAESFLGHEHVLSVGELHLKPMHCTPVCRIATSGGTESALHVQGADEDRSPGSSSAEALSSGLRSAVRQLGSSYRLGSAAAPDIPISTLSSCGPAKRREPQRLGVVGASQNSERPEEHASSKREVYELSDSEGMSLHLCHTPRRLMPAA